MAVISDPKNDSDSPRFSAGLRCAKSMSEAQCVLRLCQKSLALDFLTLDRCSALRFWKAPEISEIEKFGRSVDGQNVKKWNSGRTRFWENGESSITDKMIVRWFIWRSVRPKIELIDFVGRSILSGVASIATYCNCRYLKKNESSNDQNTIISESSIEPSPTPRSLTNELRLIQVLRSGMSCYLGGLAG